MRPLVIADVNPPVGTVREGLRQETFAIGPVHDGKACGARLPRAAYGVSGSGRRERGAPAPIPTVTGAGIRVA